MRGSVAGESSACQGASKDAVLVNCFASAGLWNKDLPAEDHKDDTGVDEVAFVKARFITSVMARIGKMVLLLKMPGSPRG